MRLVLALAGVLCLNNAVVAKIQTTTHSLPRIKEAFIAAYNRQETATLRAMLSPKLQRKYAEEKLDNAIMLCRLLTHDIYKAQGPVWGNRWHGWFAVEAEAGNIQLVLEIDNDEKIIHLVMSNDMDSRRQQCWISHIDQDD